MDSEQPEKPRRASAVDETDERIRGKVRSGATSAALESVFNDPESSKVMNRWMLRSHIMWGITLAIFFIGINYSMIWITQVYNVQSWQIAVTLTPLGAGYTAYQFYKYRDKSPQQSK